MRGSGNESNTPAPDRNNPKVVAGPETSTSWFKGVSGTPLGKLTKPINDAKEIEEFKRAAQHAAIARIGRFVRAEPLLATLFEYPANAELGVPSGGLSILQAYAREDKSEPGPMTKAPPAGLAKWLPASSPSESSGTANMTPKSASSAYSLPPNAYVAHAGTRLATILVQHAIDALVLFRKKLDEDKNHVLRYQSFVLGGVAASLSKEKDFKQADDFARFAVVASEKESRDLIEIVLSGAGYSISALGLIFTGPIGLLAIGLMEVAVASGNLYLATLQDHEQDLASTAGAFRAQAEQWAEPSVGERTAEAELNLALAAAFALLGGKAAYHEITGGGAARLTKLIDATKGMGRKVAALPGKVGAKVSDLGSKIVAGGDELMSGLLPGEYGVAETNAGVRMPARIPDSRMINMESRAVRPDNKLGVKVEDLNRRTKFLTGCRRSSRRSYRRYVSAESD